MGTDQGNLDEGLRGAGAKLKLFGRSISEIGRATLASGAAMAAPFVGALKVFDDIGSSFANFQKMQKEAAAAGFDIPRDDLKAATDFADGLNTLRIAAKVASFEIGAALAPALKDAVDWLTRSARGAIDFIRQHQGLIQVAAKASLAVVGLGVALTGLGKAMSLAGAAIKITAFTLPYLGGLLELVLNPIGLVVVGLGAAGAAFLVFTQTGQRALAYLGDQFGGLLTTAKEMWGGIKDALEAGDILMAAKVAWSGIKSAVLSNTVGMQQAWVNFTTAIEIGWVEAVGAIEKGWVTIRAYVTEGVGFLKDTWDLWATFFESTWDSIVAYLKPGIDTLTSLWQQFSDFFSSTFKAAAAEVAKVLYPLLKAGAAIGIAGAGVAAAGILAAVSALGESDVGKSFQQHAGIAGQQAEHQRGQVEEGTQGELARLEEERKRRLREVDEGVAAANQELKDALAEVAKAAQDSRDRASSAVAPAGSTQEKVESHGTFNAFAVGALGPDKMTEIAKNTQTTAEEIKKVRKALENGGAEFV
jgi:hypothetical protein